MYYTQAGGVDLLKAKWKKLSEFVSVECDGEYTVIITNTYSTCSTYSTCHAVPGVDITPKLRQHKVHSVLFLNVPCFGSGTRPWNSAHGTQRLDDGECVTSCTGDSTPHLPLPCARPDRGGGADHLPAAAAAGGGHGTLHHTVQGRELKPHMAEEAIHIIYNIHSTYCNTGSLDGRGEI